MVTGSLVGSALTLGIAGPAAAAAGAAAAWGEEIGSMTVGGGTIKIDIEQAPASLPRSIRRSWLLRKLLGQWETPIGSSPRAWMTIAGMLCRGSPTRIKGTTTLLRSICKF